MAKFGIWNLDPIHLITDCVEASSLLSPSLLFLRPVLQLDLEFPVHVTICCMDVQSNEGFFST